MSTFQGGNHHNNDDTRNGLISHYRREYRVNCNAITELLLDYSQVGTNTELRRQVGTIDYLCNEELELFWKEFNFYYTEDPNHGLYNVGDGKWYGDDECSLEEHIAQIWELAFNEWFEMSEDAYNRATEEFNEMIVEEYGDESEEAKRFQVGTFNGVVLPTHIDGRKVVSYPNAGFVEDEQ